MQEKPDMDKRDQARSCCSGPPILQEHPCSCSEGEPGETKIHTANSVITFANRLDHFLARWSWKREAHRVEPGLYKLGSPAAESPVFASANYTLSFDALRSALAGIDAWILVLDTKGINVWCAAGKGTFGTEELVRRIRSSRLETVVTHRKIIVPQLGAPGVSWPEVLRQSGFMVEFGPVRARDLPEYLKAHTATPAMRKVEFPLGDRLVLTPVELIHAALPTLVAAAVLWFLAGPVAALAPVAAVLAGTVLFPALLPFIPTCDFSSKGLILGGIVAIPFAYAFWTTPGIPAWVAAAGALAPLLVMPAVTAYLALNFTGSTTFTSRTGVKKEIFRYVPAMIVMVVAGSLSALAVGIGKLAGAI
jgi:hypothetical protein